MFFLPTFHTPLSHNTGFPFKGQACHTQPMGVDGIDLTTRPLVSGWHSTLASIFYPPGFG